MPKQLELSDLNNSLEFAKKKFAKEDLSEDSQNDIEVNDVSDSDD